MQAHTDWWPESTSRWFVRTHTPVGKLMAPPYKRRRLNSTRSVGTQTVMARTRRRQYTRRARGTVRSGVTTQRDSRTQYRRRRAPRRVRYRARRSYRRFLSSMMKLVGTRTRVFNDYNTNTSFAGQQLFTSYVLYGSHSTNANADEQGYNDINRLMQTDYLIYDVTGDAQGRSSGGDTKIAFDTGIFDITITNVSAGGDPLITFAIELDLYEFTCNGKFDKDLSTGIAGPSLHQYLVNRVGDQATSGPGAVVIDPTDRGVTPFEMGVQLRQSGTKIVRKTKYFIPYGDCITYQIRDSKNHMVSSQKLQTDMPICTSFAKGIIAVAKIIPGNYNPNNYSASIAFGLTRKYKYKIFQNAYNRGQYNT